MKSIFIESKNTGTDVANICIGAIAISGIVGIGLLMTKGLSAIFIG